jgi:hypothetical protein
MPDGVAPFIAQSFGAISRRCWHGTVAAGFAACRAKAIAVLKAFGKMPSRRASMLQLDSIRQNFIERRDRIKVCTTSTRIDTACFCERSVIKFVEIHFVSSF